MSGAAGEGSNDRVAAWLVGLPALIQLALILHHPVAAPAPGAEGAADPFASIAAVIGANRSFHAVLILLLIAQLTGVALLARTLGLHRPLVAAGSICFALAAMLLVLATTHDGFVVFELISRCRASAGGCTGGTRAALDTIMASVQAFTKLGFVAQSFGFAALAGSLLRSGRTLRLFGLAGVALALAPLGLLASGAYVGPAMIMRLLVAHAILGAGAALLLGSGRLTIGGVDVGQPRH